MSMSPAQHDRNESIIRDLLSARTHPSESERNSYADLSDDDLSYAVSYLKAIQLKSDGNEARKMIGEFWSGDGSSSVARKIRLDRQRLTNNQRSMSNKKESYESEGLTRFDAEKD